MQGLLPLAELKRLTINKKDCEEEDEREADLIPGLPFELGLRCLQRVIDNDNGAGGSSIISSTLYSSGTLVCRAWSRVLSAGVSFRSRRWGLLCSMVQSRMLAMYRLKLVEDSTRTYFSCCYLNIFLSCAAPPRNITSYYALALQSFVDSYRDLDRYSYNIMNWEPYDYLSDAHAPLILNVWRNYPQLVRSAAVGLSKRLLNVHMAAFWPARLLKRPAFLRLWVAACILALRLQQSLYPATSSTEYKRSPLTGNVHDHPNHILFQPLITCSGCA